MLDMSKNNMFINENLNDYWSVLNIKQTLNAVDLVEQECFSALCNKMNLFKVSFPNEIFLATGLDSVIGVDNFHKAVVLHKTAKWGRCAIKKYGISSNEGIAYLAKIKQNYSSSGDYDYAFENNLCWERILGIRNICMPRLEEEVFIVSDIMRIIARKILKEYGILNETFDSDLKYLTAQHLENLYPDFSPIQREYAVCKKYGIVFIEQVGSILNSGNSHLACDPDIDDWSFSGTILVWNSRFGYSQNIATVGIRVLWNKMVEQFNYYGLDVPNLPFHNLLKKGMLPCTIGGNINLSLFSMLLLNKIHIGEVSSGVWNDITLFEAGKRGIYLL